MAENSGIEWTDHTFNPWVGCTKVGPGCDGCYAEAWAKRAGAAAGVTWGGERRRTSVKNWQLPMRWNAQAEREGRRFRVFCASLADVFDNQVPPAWRAELFALIQQTPHLDWLLLTKRIGNAAAMLEAPGMQKVTPPNVWLGATIVNRDEMLRDGPKLKATPAAVRFWSVEPMLGDLGEIPRDLMPDWVIVGGESGPSARPMHPDWARSLRDQCAAAGVPFLFKQWGEFTHTVGREHIHAEPTLYQHEDGRTATEAEAIASGGRWQGMYRIGKKAAGRQLDGRTHDEFPEVARA